MKTYNLTRIFVVEDDPIISRLIRYVMESDPEHEVHVFDTGQACLDHLHLNPQIISLDYALPDMKGETVLEAIKCYNTNIQVIMLSAQQEIDVAIGLLKKGASDYIPKGAEMKERLQNSVQLLKQTILLKNQVIELQQELTNHYDFKNIVGLSQPMKGITDLVAKAVKSMITVSITGETGTGKEVVAKSIHYNSSRSKNRFVAINMTAIPPNLLESELFGYEKGAFTGAFTDKLGQFELANGGTLFLDEIGDLELSLQAKLLRALQEKEFTRIGGTKVIKFDARLIIATHQNIGEQVKKGLFRKDLYYRLLGLSIELPPLRKRGMDIILLANHFLRIYAQENKKTQQNLSQKAKDRLLNYSFPGNVRELKSIIDLAIVLSEGRLIETKHLHFQEEQSLFDMSFEEITIKDYTNKAIRYCLEKYDKNVAIVAEKLGISKSSVYKVIKE